MTKELYAKDLMCGDWVLVTIEGEKYNGVLTKIDGETEDVRVSFLGSPDDWEEGDSFDSIEPIPLTAEILEKNGIILDLDKNIYGEYFEEDEDYRLEISQGERDGIFWTINVNEYHILKLNYVHELQHAIRLCGINKEITL